MMHSLRMRITLLTVCAIVISLSIVTLFSVLFIRNNQRLESDQLLFLLCETGERNLNYYFNSVQKSVHKVENFVEADLKGLEEAQLRSHIERVRQYFEEMACKTNGVLTYYYRIDPAVSDTVKGFWYTDLNGEGFVSHEVTDITLYDVEDTSKLVWFTVPRRTRESIWLPPYVTDNLDVRVISYNVPIYWGKVFVGVVGIEIDYTTMAEQVESIRLYSNGYAFLSDASGNLFYHPRIDVTQLTPETMPPIPENAVSESTFFRYAFEGQEKIAAWLPLGNGMRLNVAVPVAETEGDWQRLIQGILIVSAAVLLVMSGLTLLYTRRITHPLEALTEAAEKVDQGDYSFALDYNGDDEVGRLTATFKRLANHMKDHINDLNKRVYIDALTSVKNKGAFSAAIDGLQQRMDLHEEPAFAIGVFDCDDLKAINDQFGHDKGDVYLKSACSLICRVFQHSPVFRIGGDEFAVILQNGDYANREALVRRFEADRQRVNAATENPWEQVSIAMGLAVYDPVEDAFAVDTFQRADKIMYENKRVRKEARR